MIQVVTRKSALKIFYSHGLLGHFHLLAALWRLPLEHVAVVGSGGGGVLGQRGAGAQLCGQGREGGGYLRSKVAVSKQITLEKTLAGHVYNVWCVLVTFVLIGAASTRVVEDGEVGGRDGVGAATAVAVVTTQAAPRGGLRVDAAGAAAALRGDRWGRAVPIWDILWLSHTNEVTITT